jgi:hypothetical protein
MNVSRGFEKPIRLAFSKRIDVRIRDLPPQFLNAWTVTISGLTTLSPD